MYNMHYIDEFDYIYICVCVCAAGGEWEGKGWGSYGISDCWTTLPLTISTYTCPIALFPHAAPLVLDTVI